MAAKMTPEEFAVYAVNMIELLSEPGTNSPRQQIVDHVLDAGYEALGDVSRYPDGSLALVPLSNGGVIVRRPEQLVKVG